MTNHVPQLSAACALLLLRNSDGTSLHNTAKELSHMHRKLTGETVDPDVIRRDLRSVSMHMAGLGFTFYVTDCPEITDAVGKVLAR